MSKAILILGAGIEQVTAIKLAQEMGLKVIAADGNPHAPGLSIADIGISIDIKNVNALVDLGSKHRVAGVMTHAVEIPQVVARVAKALGLPGLDTEVAERATNKLLRIRCFHDRGVPAPAFVEACSADGAVAKSEALRYPLVVKPVDNSGARGVTKVDHIGDLEMAFEEAVSFSKEKRVLIEEFLEGPEVSTESVILDGRIYTTGFADRNYDKKKLYEPYLIEDGHTIPSLLSYETQRQVIEVAERAIVALGIDWGVAKGDLIVDNEGPKVFEMAARTSGGRFCADMVPLATGINILRPLIQMSVGEPVDLSDLKPKHHKAAAQRFLLPPPGRVVSIDGVDKAWNVSGIYDIVLSDHLKPGCIINKLTNHAERVGHVIATGETRQEAVERAEAAVSLIRIEVERE